MGLAEYETLARDYRVPIVVTGFEPIDILQGVLQTVRQLETGRARVENAYARAVRRTGNARARELMDEVFEVVDRAWRGMGTIRGSGLDLRAAYRDFDAQARFGARVAAGEADARSGSASDAAPDDAGECIAGLVLQGLRRPADCPAFAARCTPERPLGAPMVSSEGACAAYHRYRGVGASHE
jgi:hydrogenase expression/formation protein HypD